ncbi:hypothetical protein MKX03_023953 [Papaver bracteatum]|nr:hypothetical protein MKX03_023953 [Papaver bracteatum]
MQVLHLLFNLQILELLGFQTCVHSFSVYLGSVQWVEVEKKVNEIEEEKKIAEEEGKKVSEEEEKKVNVASDVPVLTEPFIDILANMVKVVLKTDGKEGRRQGKSLVLKLIREHDSLLTDVNLAATINKNMLSSCQRCLNSLLNLFKQALGYDYVNTSIALEADNLLWLLDILVDRQSAEEFALMWANQRELANLHKKFNDHNKRTRHLVSCITTQLFVGIGNGKILVEKDNRQLLLKTWFQPLLDDYSSLRKLESFDPKVVVETIERTILELMPEDQQSILMAWFECFLKKGDACPDLLKAYEGWCRRSFGKTPPLSLPVEKEK